jgi:enoyl-CoA hydratase
MGQAIAAAEKLAALSPPAFALTKKQMRQPVAERTAANDHSYGGDVAELWVAQASHGYIRAYVGRTLKK